jgi:hypothetical protein
VFCVPKNGDMSLRVYYIVGHFPDSRPDDRRILQDGRRNNEARRKRSGVDVIKLLTTVIFVII